MMKTLLTFVLVAAATSFCEAASPEPNADGVRVVEGCLSRSGDTYVVTGGGPGPKQYRIIGGDIAGFDGKRRFTVRVTGVVSENNAQENMITPYNAGSTTGAGWNTIVAQSVETVYENCSGSGRERPIK